MMLNAPAGSGKSTLLQAVFDSVAHARGLSLPHGAPTPPAALEDPKLQQLCVIPTSFNGHTLGDVETCVPPGDGVAFRIAERFLCRAGSDFRAFRQAWLAGKGLGINLDDLMKAIVMLLGPESRVLLLIDEPGLAWCEERPKDNAGLFRSGTDLSSARAVVAATSCLRSTGFQVRIVFSSLRPVWDQHGELPSRRTRAGRSSGWRCDRRALKR